MENRFCPFFSKLTTQAPTIFKISFASSLNAVNVSFADFSEYEQYSFRELAPLADTGFAPTDTAERFNFSHLFAWLLD